MNGKDAIKLAERVEAWQMKLGPLGLTHWRIESVNVVDETPGGPGANATVESSHTYDSATFWFRHGFVDEASERELDETILHEWLHVAMRNFDRAIESVEDALSPGVEQQWEDWVHHEREGLVDKLARQIYAAYNTDREEVVR